MTGDWRGMVTTASCVQFARFGIVGASGYVVNLSLYALLLRVVGIHYLFSASASFLVAVLSNYAWNRRWTFRDARRGFAAQGVRFLVVSVAAGAINIVLLHVLVAADLSKLPAQALAVVLAMPLNFLGNKMWTFRGAPAAQDSPSDVSAIAERAGVEKSALPFG